MFNLMLKDQLTPNQFYVLYSIQENISPMHVNLHVELRVLESNNWVTLENNVAILQPKSISLIQQIESFFRVQKKKTNMQLMGDEFTDNINNYLLLFPKIKLPSGKSARSDKKNVETAFRWFFENHSYSWKTILEATSRYIFEYQTKNYLYMQTAQYYIRKQQSDKTWGSQLANYCAAVEDGESAEETHFTETVV